MKKTLISVCSIFIVLALISSAVYPWGAATHAYIADHLGKKWGLRNINEIYGAMAPDIFNYAFTLPEELLIHLRKFTHGIPPEEDSFRDVWYNARWWGLQKAVAYGYVCHNDVWGADFTAHWKGVPIPTGEYLEGYIIAKARALNSIILATIGEPADDDLIGQIYVYVLDPQTREDICHNIVESAGDILIKREDNRIGQKIIFSALLRSWGFPNLLVRTIGENYRALIIPAEKEFRKMMVLYGAALQQEEEDAIDSLSEQMAELSMAYLESKGYPLPDYVTVEAVKSFIKEATHVALSYLLFDYMDEIDATVNFVKLNMWSNRIFYW